MRTCSKCNETKELDCYWNHKRSPDGKRSHCIDCIKKYQKQWYEENKDKQIEYSRNRYFIKTFGLTAEEVDQWKAEGCCAVCGATTNLEIDHNHTTNKVRDLLCSKHNLLVGQCNENIETLEKVINYLRKHNAD